MSHLKSHFFFYSLLLLIILTVASSYYRFMVVKDFTVGYEGNCDPYSQKCYVYCEDEECEDPFYYSWIERNAGKIYNTCGGGLVTECDAAYECSNGDDSCAIYFCDASSEECESLIENDRPLEVTESDV